MHEVCQQPRWRKSRVLEALELHTCTRRVHDPSRTRESVSGWRVRGYGSVTEPRRNDSGCKRGGEGEQQSGEEERGTWHMPLVVRMNCEREGLGKHDRSDHVRDAEHAAVRTLQLPLF